VVASPPEAPSLKRELKHFITLILARGMGAPLGLLSGALLARLIGPAGVGQWAMVVAAATLLHSVFLNWSQAVLVRFGCEERQTTGRLDQTYAMRAPMLLAGAAVSALLLWLQPLQWLRRVFGLTATAIGLVAGYLAGMWLMAELQSLMQIDSRYREIAFLPTLADLLTVFFLGASLMMFQVSGTVAMTGMILIVLVVGGVGAIVEWRRLNLKAVPIVAGTVAVGAAFAWPLIPNFFVGYVSDWSDHLVLRQFFATQEVGLFQVPYQLMLLLAGLSSPVATVLLPPLIAMNVADATADRKYVQQVVPTLLVLWLPFISLVVALAPFALLILYGDRFIASVPVMAVLCIALPGTALTTFYGLLFTVQGRLTRPTIYHTVMSALNLGLSLILVPIVGVMGAALATAASYLASQWLYTRDQHVHLDVPMTAVAVLFGTTAIFALAEGLIVESLAFRLITALVFSGVVIALARWLKLADRAILDRLFADKLSGIAMLLTKVLVPATVR